MTTNLTLHRDVPDEEGEIIIPFPTTARPQPMRLVTGDETGPEPAIPVGTDIARDIEQTLDRMQQSLDEFCDQLTDSYPFPEPDDDGPGFAA